MLETLTSYLAPIICQPTLLGAVPNPWWEQPTSLEPPWNLLSTGKRQKTNLSETDQYNYNFDKAIMEKGVSGTDMWRPRKTL